MEIYQEREQDEKMRQSLFTDAEYIRAVAKYSAGNPVVEIRLHYERLMRIAERLERMDKMQ